MTRIRVKICGLTNEADALAAIAAGADGLGFNFWPGSKRFIPPESAAKWIRSLPRGATRVAVGVNPTFEEVVRWFEMTGVEAVQLHGSETPEFCAKLEEAGCRVIKAIRLESSDSLGAAKEFDGGTPLLLDAFDPAGPGGTGRIANWDLAAEVVRSLAERRIILAGGLNSENVTAAVQRVRPFAIDLASGVESPGSARRKDLSRLSDLFTTLSGAGFRSELTPADGRKGLF